MTVVLSQRVRVYVWAMVALCLTCTSAMAATGAKPPEETLRLMPAGAMAIIHINDLRATTDELIGIGERLGFEALIKMRLKEAWQMFHRQLKTSSVPQSWEDMYLQVGLPARPSATLGLIPAPQTREKFAFVAAIPLSNPTRFLRILQLMNRGSLRTRIRSCHYLCQGTLARLRMRGAQGPVSIKDFLAGHPGFATRCSMMVAHFHKSGRVACMRDPKDRARLIAQLSVPAGKKYEKAWIYDFPGMEAKFAITGNIAVIALKDDHLKAALRRFAAGKAHPLATGFAKRVRNNTHMQMYFDYPRLMTFANAQNQQSIRNNPLLRNMPMLQQFNQMSSQMIKGMSDAWMECHGGQGGFQYTVKIHTKAPRSPLVQKALSVAPTTFQTLALVPRNAIFVASMNYIQFYFEMASTFAQSMGGGFPIQAIIGPWQKILGNEVTLAVNSTAKRQLQAVLVFDLQQPDQFVAQINRLQQALGQKKPLFQTTKSNGQEIHHIFISRSRLRGAPMRQPFEVAFTVVGSQLLITFELTPNSNLQFIQNLASSKRRSASILKDPVFAKLMSRVGPTNTFFYLSAPRLLRAIGRFAPPIQRVQDILQKLSIFRYAFGHGRSTKNKRNVVGSAELKLSK